MAHMELEITQPGRLAQIDCERCGQTHYWHEWVHDGGAEDLKDARCEECGRDMDPDTYWESPSRNWYAARYQAPGYMDCTEWNYGKNKRELERETRDMYGDNE